ncbi:MAG: hypothetical protein WCH31_02550 [Actinomycetes bacterium]
MGAWYTIGLTAGLGVAFGVLGAGVAPRRVLVPLLAGLAGALVGYAVFGAAEAAGGIVGGAAGGYGAIPVVAGALRRGGTRGGLAALVAIGAAVVAALALVPALGYVEALSLPVLALRLRAKQPDRHAGLRTLARD